MPVRSSGETINSDPLTYSGSPTNTNHAGRVQGDKKSIQGSVVYINRVLEIPLEGEYKHEECRQARSFSLKTKSFSPEPLFVILVCLFLV